MATINNKNARILIVLTLTTTLLVGACRKNDNDKNGYSTNEFVKKVMDEWYYWKATMPDLDPDDYQSANEYLNALRNSRDKWSYITTKQEYDRHYVQGKMLAHGFGMRYFTESDLRVGFVYKGSPAERAGLKRGYRIVRINGRTIADIDASQAWNTIFGANQAGVTNALTVIDDKGSEVTLQIIKEEIKETNVLHYSVKQLDNGKTAAYLVYKSFIQPSIAELEEAFAYFKAQQATDLVLDLRYNGGGSLGVAKHLAMLIGGAKVKDKVFFELRHNADKKSENKAYKFDTTLANSLQINNLVCITTSGTASASEVVINGLRPYIQMVSVGQTTHGKPVGMYGFDYKPTDNKDTLVFFPICFSGFNANGEGDYFDGLQPDALRPDDLTHDFADSLETCYREAMHFLEHGSFSTPTKIFETPRRHPADYLHGLKAELQTF